MRRRLCSGVTLFAYLVAVTGFPLPATPVRSARDATACGQQVCCCGTAEQCKTSGCCCSHRTEQPPPDPAPEEDAPPDCCSHQSKKPAPPASCCVKKTTPSESTQEATKIASKPKGKTVRWVIGISALKCRGGATQWINAQAALPMPAPLTWQPSWPYCHSLPVTQERSFVISQDVLDPPPRLDTV